MEEDALCGLSPWLSRALVRGGGQPFSLFPRWPFQSWHAPVWTHGSSFPQDICFSVAALGSVPGRLWHSTQSKPECKELKMGQVLHVNDRREAESASVLLGRVDTGLACRAPVGWGWGECEHTGVARRAQAAPQ